MRKVDELLHRTRRLVDGVAAHTVGHAVAILVASGSDIKKAMVEVRHTGELEAHTMGASKGGSFMEPYTAISSSGVEEQGGSMWAHEESVNPRSHAEKLFGELGGQQLRINILGGSRGLFGIGRVEVDCLTPQVVQGLALIALIGDGTARRIWGRLMGYDTRRGGEHRRGSHDSGPGLKGTIEHEQKNCIATDNDLVHPQLERRCYRRAHKCLKLDGGLVVVVYTRQHCLEV
mmetsp:Transcript_12757/g.26093  ORF Transcript_12757/g.26093 Transcript_12757/m.26093 type:complete len:232 (-) Transcript_12757:465-1160(-)